MNELPEPIKSALRDYCHVEWHELDELAYDIQTKSQKFDVDKLKDQFEAPINSREDCSHQINQITSNEFGSGKDARAWLSGIYQIVFR